MSEWTNEKLDALLEFEFECDDLNRILTIREYLHTLLHDLWVKEESFSGKRPFGNSGWQWDVYYALFQAKAIPGEDDEEFGFDPDKEAGNAVTLQLIRRMCLPTEAPQ